MKSKLGWGSFSTVWRCEDQEEGCSGVAVKVVQSEKIATAMAKGRVPKKKNRISYGLLPNREGGGRRG